MILIQEEMKCVISLMTKYSYDKSHKELLKRNKEYKKLCESELN